MMIYVIALAGEWRGLWPKIITINFLNIHLDYASIFFFFRFFFGGVKGEGGVRETGGSLKARWVNGTIK